MFKPFKRNKYIQVDMSQYLSDNPFERCPKCKEILIQKELLENLKVCPKCGHHFRLKSWERIAQIVDEGNFLEFDADLQSENPLDFSGYGEKLQAAMEATGLKEAVLTGQGKLNGQDIILAVMDSTFMMGSMGSVVGEKIARAMEAALEKQLPVLIFAASGGARMQEGVFSLMQMAKTASLLKQIDQAGLLYLSVLTDPTTGGVTASFASLGDIVIAEPGALIGFAGPRVIEQTIGQKLPEGFQRAEFLLKKGLIDLIVPRKDLKDTLGKIIKLHVKES